MNFEQFINEFKQDDLLIKKYNRLQYIQIAWIYLTGLIVGLIVLLGEADDKNPQPDYLRPLFAFVPDVLPSTFYFGIQADVWILLSFLVISGLIAIRLTQLRSQSELSSQDVFYHYLALSSESYLNENLDDCLDYLIRARSCLYKPFMSASLPPERTRQIDGYAIKIRKNQESNSDTELKRTFEPVIGPICEQIYDIHTDDSIEQTIEDIEIPIEGEENIYFEIFSEFLGPLFDIKWRRVVVLVGLIVGGVAIGFTFGQQWAVILLTVLVVYLGLSD